MDPIAPYTGNLLKKFDLRDEATRFSIDNLLSDCASRFHNAMAIVSRRLAIRDFRDKLGVGQLQYPTNGILCGGGGGDFNRRSHIAPFTAETKDMVADSSRAPWHSNVDSHAISPTRHSVCDP